MCVSPGVHSKHRNNNLGLIRKVTVQLRFVFFVLMSHHLPDEMTGGWRIFALSCLFHVKERSVPFVLNQLCFTSMMKVCAP